VSVAEQIDRLTPGQLANNAMLVQCLQKLLQGKEYNLKVLAETVQNIGTENGPWRAFAFTDSPEVHRWGPADFRKFIEADRPAGCQTKCSVVEQLLRGSPAWETWLTVTRGTPGNPTGANQYTKEEGGNCDNVTVSSPALPPPTGNSVSYAVRRLQKNRPDLYERVKSGELTSNAAMIEAGFREP